MLRNMSEMVSFAHSFSRPTDLTNWPPYVDIDIISTSAIHQGVSHVDFSLKINH